MNHYTYDDWTELLADFFFDEAHDGNEILFAVDEVSLAEASGLPEADTGDSLAAAVLLVIGREWNVGAVRQLVERWRKLGSNGPHPALPFLALTVLSASRMGSYEEHAPHNFYVPLRRVLVSEDPELGAPGTYLDHIRYLWDDLARWANTDRAGRYGRLTIHAPGRQYGRGLAIQHALVKSYDLRQLDAFFRRIGLQPGEEVASAELCRALAVWTAGRPEPWAQRLHRVSSEAELNEYAEALLAREALRWDGRPRDPRTGRAVGRIRLGFSSARRPDVGVFVEWDERLPEDVEICLPAGDAIALERDHGWFAPHPLQQIDVAEAMSRGVTLRGDAHRFDLGAEDAYAVAYDDDLGAWVSVDTMSYGNRYHLLVRCDVASEVLRFVQGASATEARMDETASKSLPAGWRLIADVRVDARPESSPPNCLGTLIPVGAGPRLRLLGGLPLAASHGVYLRGGEPALALSTLTNDDGIFISRQSTGHTERFRAPAGSNREVPLWEFQLEPDMYEISHGGSKVRLQIVDGITDAAGPGAGTVRHPGRGSVVVVGTSTSPSADLQPPLTVPAPTAGDAVIVLGARPSEHHVVRRPSWLSSLVGFDLSWKSIDAWPDFDPVWLVVRGRSGRFEASLLRATEPDTSDGVSGSRWARLIAVATLGDHDNDESSALWARYRAASGANP